MRRVHVSVSGRVAVRDGDVWTVVGSVEVVGSGWLAYAGERRIYGPGGPVFATREDAAEAVANVIM